MATPRAARLRVYKRDGKVSALEWKFYDRDPPTSEPNEKGNVWTREQYDQWANTRRGLTTLSFDEFVQAFKVFMMGKHGTRAEIPEIFQILDTDHSNDIDLQELAVFMPFILGNNNYRSEMLAGHVRKVHHENNDDLKMNKDEFTNLIMEDVGIEIVLGRN